MPEAAAASLAHSAKPGAASMLQDHMAAAPANASKQASDALAKIAASQEAARLQERREMREELAKYRQEQEIRDRQRDEGNKQRDEMLRQLAAIASRMEAAPSQARMPQGPGSSLLSCKKLWPEQGTMLCPCHYSGRSKILSEG